MATRLRRHPASSTLTLECPREVGGDAHGADACGAEVVVETTFTPGEWYGQDADGNRGVWQRGYWEVESVPTSCAEGHELTSWERAKLEGEARRRCEREGETIERGED